VHVDAEVGIEFVGHAAEARAEWREDSRRIVDARMARPGRDFGRQGSLPRGRFRVPASLPVPRSRTGGDGEQEQQEDRSAAQARPRLQRQWP
jgi:hypothetical protein